MHLIVTIKTHNIVDTDNSLAYRSKIWQTMDGHLNN